MSKKQLRKIRRWFDHDIRTFDFSKYPHFFDIRIAAGQFGWKPVIIEEVAQQSGGIVCWMDAGNLLTEALTSFIASTVSTGFWRTSSNGTIGKWTHLGMLSHFNLPADWNANDEMCAGGCVAFDTENPRARSLLRDWAKYAQIKDCIAPEGSNRGNHRQDQALLAVLAGMAGWPPPKGMVPMPLKFQQDADANIGHHIYRHYKRLRNWYWSMRGLTKPQSPP